MIESTADRIRAIYESLLSEFGPQAWWPSESPFETAVGAILTQRTSWRNAALALANLREAGALSPSGMEKLTAARLRELVRPAGFFRRKARTLGALTAAIAAREGGLEALLALETEHLRRVLLGIEGIGSETADAIILYAARRPVFTVDAYARRVAERHGMVDAKASYGRIASLFEESLGHEVEALNECHALIVEVGKRFCRPIPECAACPINWDLPNRGDT